MSIVVAVETSTGVAIAGDTRIVDGEAVSSHQFRRVFDLGGVGVGVGGESGAVQQFRQRFETALRERGPERDDSLDVDAAARLAARVTRRAGVDAVVAARADGGAAGLRHVAADGRVLDSDEVALGTGSRIVLGLPEALAPEASTPGEATDDPAAVARNALETAIERDVDTGGELDVWSLGSADRTERGVRRFESEAKP
ncbi:20S proteasome A and B subunits [Halorubrum lipolyticum]|uniref:20S proteasome A and B subunits n=1 Tax=Halorubrum lipolyticum DSM 21995 TaxID=1227482 RepID=M0P3Z1_9EURY|nr:20S proteasome A and B subunits [Halorubrum lipolyticum]EMA64269.1 20S proteasome A and B subunits [Halorubrum lipolyticum DSM 21995]